MWKEPPARELGESGSPGPSSCRSPPPRRAAGLYSRGRSRNLGGGNEAEEAYAVSEALGNPSLVVHACEAQALAATEAGRYGKRGEWADRALAAAPARPPPILDPRATSTGTQASSTCVPAGSPACGGLPRKLDRLASSLSPHDEVHVVARHVLLESVLGNWEDVLTESDDASRGGNGGKRGLPLSVQLAQPARLRARARVSRPGTG